MLAQRIVSSISLVAAAALIWGCVPSSSAPTAQREASTHAVVPESAQVAAAMPALLAGVREVPVLPAAEPEQVAGVAFTAEAEVEAEGPAELPPSLELVAYWPPDGATDISPTTDLIFRFSDDIENSAAVERSIAFDPAIPGDFQWLAPNRVRFRPEVPFPPETEINAYVGPNGVDVRGMSGGLLDRATRFSFTTGKLKTIEVSLRQQRLTLYEGDEAVWSAPVATGVRGAETPLGTYRVEYKMPVARFRGVNPSGARYDIPNVRWVLAFFGDYTIHGAYWRSNFGTPGSNGCISLTDANAKRVFDWADEGTPIVIRA